MHRASTRLADILHLALCCHINKTRAPIANPPNSAQLEGTPTIPLSYIQVHAVVLECGEGQTDTRTAVTTIHFTSSTTRAKCNKDRIMLGINKRILFTVPVMAFKTLYKS